MENPYAFQNLKTESHLPVILQISQPWNICLIFCITLSLVWGSAMKILVYIKYTKHKILTKPINLLILVDQITNHSINIFIGLNIVIELWFGLTPTQFAKTYLNIDVQTTVYCKTFFFLGIFMSAYLQVGNSILAIYRTIYLMKPNFVKHVIGEKLALIVSLVGGYLVTTIMTYLYVSEGFSTSAIYNMCVGHSQFFEVSFIIICAQFTGGNIKTGGKTTINTLYILRHMICDKFLQI